jgi:Fe-S oxidoreductase
MSAASTVPTKAEVTEGCRFCWMCRQACPVGFVTARETFTPHAWALTIESVRRKQLSWNRETADVMFACADCGLCQAHCATDRPLPDAINATRVELTSAGLAPAAVYEVDKQLKAFGNAFAKTTPVAKAAGGSVALFVGDAAAHLRPAAVDAAKRLLAAAGVTAGTIGEGRSSGLLASTLGLQSTAVDLAKAVVAEVTASGAKEVLVLSPGDRWTFTHVYGTRLGVSWPQGVVVREVTEVLAEAVIAGKLAFIAKDAGAYAYLDPSHSPRVAKSRPAPRALLAATYGAGGAKNPFWREDRAHPAGTAGGLNLTNPAIANQLAASRFEDAASAGAAWVVTEDALDLHHLTSRAPASIAVKGLFEALAERL